MLDQAFDAAEAFGQREQLRALQELRVAGKVAVELDGDHAAEGLHLRLGERVLRMAARPG